MDGDTFQIDGQRIRIENIDAPEIHSAKCTAEAVLGWEALTRLAEILGEGRWELKRAPGEKRDEDRYWRKLRRLVSADSDVGEQVVAEGLGPALDRPKDVLVLTVGRT